MASRGDGANAYIWLDTLVSGVVSDTLGLFSFLNPKKNQIPLLQQDDWSAFRQDSDHRS